MTMVPFPVLPAPPIKAMFSEPPSKEWWQVKADELQMAGNPVGDWIALHLSGKHDHANDIDIDSNGLYSLITYFILYSGFYALHYSRMKWCKKYKLPW